MLCGCCLKSRGLKIGQTIFVTPFTVKLMAEDMVDIQRRFKVDPTTVDLEAAAVPTAAAPASRPRSHGTRHRPASRRHVPKCGPGHRLGVEPLGPRQHPLRRAPTPLRHLLPFGS